MLEFKDPYGFELKSIETFQLIDRLAQITEALADFGNPVSVGDRMKLTIWAMRVARELRHRAAQHIRSFLDTH